MRGALTDFLGTLFRRNTFQETPIFRGFYFTSGTQEGRPLDRVMAGMARAFGLRSGPSEEEGQAGPVEPKSYFLTDLFKQIVFPDQNVAARTAGEPRRQLFLRLAYAAAAMGILFAIILLLRRALLQQQDPGRPRLDLVHRRRARPSGCNLRRGPTSSRRPRAVDALLERLRDARELARQGPADLDIRLGHVRGRARLPRTARV